MKRSFCVLFIISCFSSLLYSEDDQDNSTVINGIKFIQSDSLRPSTTTQESGIEGKVEPADNPKLPSEKIPQNPLTRIAVPQNSLPRNDIPQGRIPNIGIPRESLPQNSIPRNSLPQQGIERNRLPRNRIPQNRLTRGRVVDEHRQLKQELEAEKSRS